MPGVLGVYTGADLAAYGTLKCIVPFKNRDGTTMKKPPRPALPTDKVRFVGDPVACVVAETLAAGEGRRRGGRARHRAAAGRDHGRERGGAPGAPQLYDDVPGNVALDFHYGDSEKVAAAFAEAAHVTQAQAASTTASSSTRWSRAPRSASTTRRASASRCTPAARACSA